jgi:tRNA threonylcarbamoyl adenosine modification protein YeaZ
VSAILAIDGASGQYTVGAQAEGQSALVSFDIGRRQSEKLPSSVYHVLDELGLAAGDLDYAVVDRGPGAFTGLRLAYVTVKALSLALPGGLPIYAVPTLGAYCAPFRTWSGAVVGALDAKQGRFFTNVMRRGTECAPTAPRSPEELAALLDPEEPVLLTGPDSPLLCDFLAALRPRQDLRTIVPGAETIRSLYLLAKEQIAGGTAPLRAWEGPEYFV